MSSVPAHYPRPAKLANRHLALPAGVIVVDSSALIAILRREAEADPFLQVIATADLCLVSALNLLETSMVLSGRSGDAASWADLDALIARAAMQVVALDRDLALGARQAFLRYGKGRHAAGLNLGDCAAYALAKTRGLKLLFKAGDFAATDVLPALLIPAARSDDSSVAP